MGAQFKDKSNTPILNKYKKAITRDISPLLNPPQETIKENNFLTNKNTRNSVDLRFSNNFNNKNTLSPNSNNSKISELKSSINNKTQNKPSPLLSNNATSRHSPYLAKEKVASSIVSNPSTNINIANNIKVSVVQPKGFQIKNFSNIIKHGNLVSSNSDRTHTLKKDLFYKK